MFFNDYSFSDTPSYILEEEKVRELNFFSIFDTYPQFLTQYFLQNKLEGSWMKERAFAARGSVSIGVTNEHFAASAHDQYIFIFLTLFLCIFLEFLRK